MWVITCQSKKMIPAATANQTTTVSKLNRIGVRFLAAIDDAY
jgi:hypothetical protein